MFETCTIRPLTHADLPLVLAWRNHHDVRRFMLTQHEISLDEHQAWFAKVSQDNTRRLLIISEGNENIGFVQFSKVSIGGIADWGFYARPGAPKGSGTKLGWRSLTYAFEEIGLHKVCGQAIESNLASIAFHAKLGFKHEGFLRDQERIAGQYHSLVCFGLLAHEWRNTQLSLEATHDQN